MSACQREPSVRLAGVGIVEEKDTDTGWLFLGFPAQAALASFECFLFVRIAIASDEVGSQNQRGEQCCGN